MTLDPLGVVMPMRRATPAEPEIPAADDSFDPDEIGRGYGDEPPIAPPIALSERRRAPQPDVLEPTSAPSFTARRGEYVFEWAAPTCLRVEIGRVADRRDELTAEVTVHSTAPGLERQLVQKRVTLLGPRSVAELSKALTARMRGQQVDAIELLEHAFTRAIAAHREGEPAIFLRDVPVPTTAGRLMPHALDGAVATFLYGAGGDGKSTIALATLVAIQTGRQDILGIRPSATRRCALFDWEGDGWEPRQRLEWIAGEEMPEIVYVRCTAAIWDELDRLQRIVTEHGIELAMVDSVGMACGGLPPESSEAALRFNAAFRSLGIGGLLIGHKTKAEGGDEYPFGSVFWHNTARATWLVKKQSELSASGFVSGLFNKKANTGPISAPLAFDITYEPGRIRFGRRDAHDVAEFAPQVTLRWRIQQALRGGPRSQVELAADLEAELDSVRKALKRHEGKVFTHVTSADRVERWALLAHEAAS